MRLRIPVFLIVFVAAWAGAAFIGEPAAVATSSISAATTALTNGLTYAHFVPYAAGDPCSRFYDTFDDPATDWFTGQANGLQATIHEGEYRLLFSGPGSVWFITAPVCELAGYHAAVDARWAGTPGNFIGLLFGIDEAQDRAYVFAVNTDERVWMVFEARNNALETIIAPAGHDAVRPGNAVNRLAAVRQGDTIFLSVNGTAVGELHDANPGAPVLAGVVAASYTTQSTADARFDNFVWELVIND